MSLLGPSTASAAAMHHRIERDTPSGTSPPARTYQSTLPSSPRIDEPHTPRHPVISRRDVQANKARKRTSLLFFSLWCSSRHPTWPSLVRILIQQAFGYLELAGALSAGYLDLVLRESRDPHHLRTCPPIRLLTSTQEKGSRRAV